MNKNLLSLLTLGVMAVACVVLGWLQYRWTGELSRTETQRLKANLETRLQQMARAFNGEIARDVAEFTPTPADLRDKSFERAHLDRMRAALERNERPVFKRYMVAVPNASRTALDLWEGDAINGSSIVKAAAWPAGWETLRDRLTGILQGESARRGIIDPDSNLLETPVFVDGEEAEWDLFEIDIEYARLQWLPQLVREHLGEDEFQVSIERKGVIFSTSGAAILSPDATVGILPERLIGMMEGRGGGGPRDGGGGPRGGPGPGAGPGPGQGPGDRDRDRGRGGGGAGAGRWILKAQHRAGSAEAAAESARIRNLSVSLALLALIAVAGSMLVQSMRRADQLSRMQLQFVAGVSHDIRTPLTVIRGAAHNLLTGVVQNPATQQTYLRQIVRNADQLTDMVEQLLEHAAIVRNRKAEKPELTSVAVSEALSNAVDIASDEISAAGASLDLDLPDALPSVRGNPAALEQAFRNLLGNAAKHGGRGTIAVTAKLLEGGGRVAVRIADSGPGIAPEDLPHIFDPFFRGAQARDNGTRGAGLGLSLVRERIEACGGKVYADASATQGAAFIVELQAAAAAAATAAATGNNDGGHA